MGANYVSFTVQGTQEEVLKAFDRAQEQDRYENGHCYSGGIGMARGLKFVDAVSFVDQAKADQWISDHAEKWDEALAVRILRPGGRRGARTYLIGAWCAS
jgi:hypothetical protein